jgi:hypothetical protein
LIATSNRILGILACFGLLRFWNPESKLIDGLPARQYSEMKAFLALPRQWLTGADGLMVWESMTRAQVNNARSLNDMPLAVLSVTEQDRYAEVLTALQAELPRLSSNSTHRTVEGATHDGLVCKRENALIVAEAIRQVIEAAHTGQPLTDQR